MSEKSRVVACFLAIFLGWIGIHKFYLGRVFQGLFYMFFSLIGLFWIVIFISFIEAFLYLLSSKSGFEARYSPKLFAYKEAMKIKSKENEPTFVSENKADIDMVGVVSLAIIILFSSATINLLNSEKKENRGKVNRISTSYENLEEGEYRMQSKKEISVYEPFMRKIESRVMTKIKDVSFRIMYSVKIEDSKYYRIMLPDRREGLVSVYSLAESNIQRIH